MFNSTEKYGFTYNKILNKFSDGTFTDGNNCKIPHYIRDGHIRSVPVEQRNAGLCIGLMSYGRCSLSDVPEKERTREFYLGAFSGTSLGSGDVRNYIRNNIEQFDRQFFKDLIVTDKYATHFEGNCFTIMPLKYIDEEMCSLAILNTTDWSSEEWVKTVYRKKPEALTSDIWKLVARLYARTNNAEEMLNMTPDEYKDEEYYLEMCSPSFNCGMTLDSSDLKKGIMDFMPEEMITPRFLGALLGLNVKNVTRFNEVALETELPIPGPNDETVLEKAWKIAVRIDGYTIGNIPLNDERIEYFFSLYGKDSSEYKYGLKDNLKAYNKKKNNPEALAETQERTKRNAMMNATVILGSAMSDNPNAADETSNHPTSRLLPIRYNGFVPEELCKDYDRDEYLELLYKELGIKIVEEYDNLFYSVIIPDGWVIEQSNSNHYWHYVKDNKGNDIIEYFYVPKFYDREAYVKTVNVPQKMVAKSDVSEMDSHEEKKNVLNWTRDYSRNIDRISAIWITSETYPRYEVHEIQGNFATGYYYFLYETPENIIMQNGIAPTSEIEAKNECEKYEIQRLINEIDNPQQEEETTGSGEQTLMKKPKSGRK